MKEYTEYEKFCICCALIEVTSKKLEDPLSRRICQSMMILSDYKAKWEKYLMLKDCNALRNENLIEGYDTLEESTMREAFDYNYKFSLMTPLQRIYFRNDLYNYVNQTKYVFLNDYLLKECNDN